MRTRTLNYTLLAVVVLLVGVAIPGKPLTLEERFGDLDIEGPIAVLGFWSDCVPCQKAAPHWRDELDHATYPVVAVSHEPEEAARAFADAYGWSVRVLSSSGVNETPWAFVYDAEGNQVYSALGDDLTPIEEVMEELWTRRE